MKKENSRTNYIVIALLVLVIGISIGYAALSATLNIYGSSTIGKASWDVHFANIIETAGGVTATKAATKKKKTKKKAATITSGNATEVTYDVTLAKPGDYYEFEVDVENTGTLPAKISTAPTLGGVSAAQDVYLNYTVKWKDSNADPATGDEIAAGDKKTAVVRIEYDKNVSSDQLPTTGETLALTFSMNFVQA